MCRGSFFAMISLEALHALFLKCTGVCTDTRQIVPGAMFVALKGPRFDANAFAAKALEQGARYALVDDPAVVVDDRFLLVPHGLTALQQLARRHRRSFPGPVIAITGTNGKTTTKELMAMVMAAHGNTLATQGNLNNEIGVPLTLLRLSMDHRYAIVEMGAGKPGDIDELCRIAEPTHGLITNIGRAHLQGFGSVEGVVATKTELYRYVQAGGGHLFVNNDDPLLMAHSASAHRTRYGTTGSADVSGDSVGSGPFLSLLFTGLDGLAHHADTRLVGAYNLPNALAAIAVGQHFGVPDPVIAQALAAYEPGNSRSQFRDSGRNHLVLDAYNANPSSMAVALRNFAALPTERPKRVILGDMLELGTQSAKEHQGIVDLVHGLGLHAWYVGKEFSAFAPKESVWTDAAALAKELEADPLDGHLVLVKGSRGIGLEVVAALL